MISYQFLLPFISGVNDGNETFPTDVPEPEHSMIYPQPGTVVVLVGQSFYSR